MTLYTARVGRGGDTCDRCEARIPPHGLCWAATPDALYCQRCGDARSRADASDAANARLRGDRTEPTP